MAFARVPIDLEQRSRPVGTGELARHELVGSILRWTSGPSSAQNSEITLINIGKSWVATAILSDAAVACPRLSCSPIFSRSIFGLTPQRTSPDRPGWSGSCQEPTCRRWRVASIESILGAMQFEKVHTIRDIHDGIRSGTADLSGAPHYFASLLMTR
jgi:hypothetical protein